MKVFWISIETQLPDYEVPVYLKDSIGVYVGYRDHTNKTGETYHLLMKPDYERKKSKIIYWAKLEMPD